MSNLDVNASFKSFYNYNDELEPSTAISPSDRSLSLGDINHVNEDSLTTMPLTKPSSDVFETKLTSKLHQMDVKLPFLDYVYKHCGKPASNRTLMG